MPTRHCRKTCMTELAVQVAVPCYAVNNPHVVRVLRTNGSPANPMVRPGVMSEVGQPTMVRGGIFSIRPIVALGRAVACGVRRPSVHQPQQRTVQRRRVAENMALAVGAEQGVVMVGEGVGRLVGTTNRMQSIGVLTENNENLVCI